VWKPLGKLRQGWLRSRCDDKAKKELPNWGCEEVSYLRLAVSGGHLYCVEPSNIWLVIWLLICEIGSWKRCTVSNVTGLTDSVPVALVFCNHSDGLQGPGPVQRSLELSREVIVMFDQHLIFKYDMCYESEQVRHAIRIPLQDAAMQTIWLDMMVLFISCLPAHKHSIVLTSRCTTAVTFNHAFHLSVILFGKCAIVIMHYWKTEKD